MEEFKVRLLTEITELEEKVHKLNTFIDTDSTYESLSFKEKMWLFFQHIHMKRYLYWLEKRISKYCTNEDIIEFFDGDTKKSKTTKKKSAKSKK